MLLVVNHLLSKLTTYLQLRTRIMEAELAKLRIEVEKPAKAAEQAKQ